MNDKTIIILFCVGLAIMIPLLVVVNNDESNRMNRLEDTMISFHETMDCEKLKYELDYWDRMFLKPHRVVESLESYYEKLECNT